MIDFKNNVKELLPYNRRQYLTRTKWFGVSFQVDSERQKLGFNEFIKVYMPLFENVISQFDDNSIWIVNHDDKEIVWLPNDNENLIHLRALFKQKNVPNSYKGALIFTKNELINFSNDLIAYPYAILSQEGFLYKNLDISHSKIQFVIKISGHLNIDFLSTNKDLLREVVNKNASNLFNVKEYRNTSLA